MKQIIATYLQSGWELFNHPNAGKSITEIQTTAMGCPGWVSFKIGDQTYQTSINHLSDYIQYTMPSLEFATKCLIEGIDSGLYHSWAAKRILHLCPNVFYIDYQTFRLSVWKVHGVFRGVIDPTIREHWGISPVNGKEK
jgi:hypothetical protein